MALFGKKKAQPEEQGEKDIVGFTKSKRFLFLKTRSKPVYGATQQTVQEVKPGEAPKAYVPSAGEGKKLTPFQQWLYKQAAKHKELPAALKEAQIKKNPYEFVRAMFMYSVIVGVIVGVTIAVLLYNYNLPIAEMILYPILFGGSVFYAAFNKFITYPLDRTKSQGKEIERDILFAARDMVVSMRSGMPLFNAMAAVSSGYGAASREFAKVIELVQLGMPIEQAIDEVSAKSQSKSFKRLMLQASVSIKAGADITTALQGVVEDVTQERIIDLRRYGQRLNALAMFYMLFGIIFPSMGIAVAAILTTFISIFTVDSSTLVLALVLITGIQVIFLNFMRSSRPSFAL